MKKTFKVVMLPTEKVSNLYIQNNKLCYDEYTVESVKGCNDQHLYIISDDEIKEGDWFIAIENTLIKKCTSVNRTISTLSTDSGYSYFIDKSKKIVATTDSLHVFRYDYLPQLPESFIQAYIKAYNEGKPITEVDLEMWQTKLYIKPEDLMQYRSKPKELQHSHTSNPNDIWNIKTRPDNTVIVHQSKMYSQAEYDKLLEQIGKMQLEMYTKEQVIKLLNNYRHFAQSGNLSIEMMEKWIQENL